MIILDGVAAMSTLGVAHLIRLDPSIPYPFTSDISDLSAINPPLYILVAIVWVASLFQFGLYDPEKNLRVVDEIYNLLIAGLISFTILSGVFYITNVHLSRLLFIISTLTTGLLMILHRSIYRQVYQHKVIYASKQQRLLIAGAGKVGRSFEKKVRGLTPWGYRLVGFVDDNPDLQIDHSDILGNIDQAVELVREHHIHHLVIALPQSAYKRVSYLVEEVHKLPVRVWVIPDYFALMLSSSSVINFAGIPMINLRASALNDRQRLRKRILDLVLAVPAFILTLPLFGVIALLIKLDSKGSVIYLSPRIKENAETFMMIKFRTMVDRAHDHLVKVIIQDENGAITHKRAGDPRVTRIGRLLRKTSLDELPQLLNIIHGDMSLVGPRPEIPEMVKYYKAWQHERFNVPQGLTGWWQVNGRSDKPMHLNTENDIYYIQHYSFWFDIQIIIKTVLVVLRGKGAY